MPEFACVGAPGGTAPNKLGQSYADMRAALETRLAAYDAQDRTEWGFAPIAELYSQALVISGHAKKSTLRSASAYSTRG